MHVKGKSTRLVYISQPLPIAITICWNVTIKRAIWSILNLFMHRLHVPSRVRLTVLPGSDTKTTHKHTTVYIDTIKSALRFHSFLSESGSWQGLHRLPISTKYASAHSLQYTSVYPSKHSLRGPPLHRSSSGAEHCKTSRDDSSPTLKKPFIGQTLFPPRERTWIYAI